MDFPYAPHQCTELLGSLGPLELSVLQALCAREEATARQVMESLETKYAYSSIATTLDRLFKKGVARRRQDLRTFVYKANLTPENILERRAIQIIQFWLTRSKPDVIISQLLDSIADCDAALLTELERKVQERRKELGRTALTAPETPSRGGAT